MHKGVDLKNYNIALVATAVVCKAEEMAEWIRAKCRHFALVIINSQYAKDVASSCEYYRENVLKKKFKLISYRHSVSFIDPAFFLCFSLSAHFFSVCYAFFRLRKKFDIYLGIGYFDTLIGLLLRRLGICNRVIYYSGDYFRSCEKWDWKNWYRSLQTKIFQFIDRINVRFSDAIWNTSTPMFLVRKEKKIFVPRKTPQIVIPLGLTIQEGFLKNKKYDTNEVVFIGNLQKNQGLELFLDILPELINDIPDIKLHVIGTGSYEKELKNLVTTKHINDYVKFYGFVRSQQTLNEIFSRCVLGLAQYIPQKESFTQYVTPGKVMTYLSWALPVIMTNVSEIAGRIRQAKAGIIIDYSKTELKEAVLKLLKNKELLNLYGQNAKNLAFEYSWDRLYSRAFSETLQDWGMKS